MRERDGSRSRGVWNATALAAVALLACASRQIGVAYDPDEAALADHAGDRVV